MAAFARVRKPLGVLVEKAYVWRALRVGLRNKISIRTVGNRLAEKGYTMQEKLARDDQGEAWRRARVSSGVGGSGPRAQHNGRRPYRASETSSISRITQGA